MKLLDKILGKNKMPNNTGQTYEEAVQERQKEAAAQYQRDKLAWEKENEALKLRDACYLGLDNRAFYGSYEMWLRSFRILPEMYNQQISQAQMVRLQHPNNIGFYSNGIFGGLFK